VILPNVRASFGRDEAGTVVRLLAGSDEVAGRKVADRLRDEGLDSLLDDPRTLNAVLTAEHNAPSRLVFYLLVRHALLETGIDDRLLADYIAAVLMEFGKEDRAYRIDAAEPEKFFYLVDLVAAADTPDGRRQFLLRAHLGNFALWLSGIFPDYVTARVHRRGAPGLEYYEEMGATGYRLAADTRAASDHGLDGLYRLASDAFPDLRVALNRISDRYFFPGSGGAVDRMLRQISDAFDG
jgi:hypothetical protein